jgi:replicative DNA helicase
MLLDAGPKALEFVLDFFAHHGTMPTLDTVEQSIGEELEEETPEPFKYYIELLKKRWIGNTLNDAIIDTGQALEKRDVDTALTAVKDAVKRVGEKNVSISDVGLVDLRDTTQDRWDRYQHLKKLKGQIDGLPFPWPAMNDATMGIHKGELWFIVARLKIGKTWSEIALADHFLRFQNKVLLVTMEMSVSQISTRIDAMYAKLPYGDFKCGRLDPHLEKKFADSLMEWKADGQLPLWVCGKGRLRTVQDLELLIEELKPNIVLIDGVYLMRTGGGSDRISKWEKVSTIADELQDLTQRKQVPILATTQFNRKVTRKRIDAGSEDIGFSLELAQNCHGLIALFQTEEMRHSKEMLVRLLEIRDGEPVSLYISWDFTTMDFSQKSIVTAEQLNTSSDDDDEGPIKY